MQLEERLELTNGRVIGTFVLPSQQDEINLETYRSIVIGRLNDTEKVKRIREITEPRGRVIASQIGETKLPIVTYSDDEGNLLNEMRELKFRGGGMTHDTRLYTLDELSQERVLSDVTAYVRYNKRDLLGPCSIEPIAELGGARVLVSPLRYSARRAVAITEEDHDLNYSVHLNPDRSVNKMILNFESKSPELSFQLELGYNPSLPILKATGFEGKKGEYYGALFAHGKLSGIGLSNGMLHGPYMDSTSKLRAYRKFRERINEIGSDYPTFVEEEFGAIHRKLNGRIDELSSIKKAKAALRRRFGIRTKDKVDVERFVRDYAQAFRGEATEPLRLYRLE